ncbi:MAG: class I SAM-dependent rRNA methyltransferase [Oscillospiraceae bacterium]|nr:class I SAM-dependent rRNA methyltransferase [Oscillospiraceae bacterium]
MEYPKVCLRRGEERDIRGGKCWIFDNELDWADDICVDGGVVDVLDSRERFVARGYLNRRSKITVRVLTLDRNEMIDRAFFRNRIAAAWARRQALGFDNSCRVVFGEADGLPGLTVDKFSDYLSFQTVALGIDCWKADLIAILAELFDPKGIMERNDVAVREKEGLPQQKGCVYGEVPPLIEIREHDARMLCDLLNGQKTGHFLDQQENRGRIRPYVGNRTVLDLCCCTGGFSIHASLYGASSVEAVDSSADALRMVRENAARNGCGNIETTAGDVFDVVKRYSEEGRRFGAVILDPPAFAKSRQAVEGAYRGYKELNLRAMRLVERGGYLITCSCSQFVTPELFLKMLREAAADSGRSVSLLELLMQSRDHPAALSAEQSLYLKGYILQVQ